MKGRIMQRLIGGVQTHFVVRLPEWVMAAVLVAEGWLLLMPGDTLSSTKAYAPLAVMAGESVWGASAVTIGVLWIVALVLNGTFAGFRRISPWARSACCLAMMSYMTTFATGMRIGNPVGDGFIMHGGWAALALAYCAIIAREVRFVDREAMKWRQLQSNQASSIRS